MSGESLPAGEQLAAAEQAVESESRALNLLHSVVRAERPEVNPEVLQAFLAALHGAAGSGEPDRLALAVDIYRLMRTGVAPFDGANPVPFASACMFNERIDVLKAVTTAGMPTWLPQLRRYSSPREEFEAYGFSVPLPCTGPLARLDWLELLRSSEGDDGSRLSLSVPRQAAMTLLTAKAMGSAGLDNSGKYGRAARLASDLVEFAVSLHPEGSPLTGELSLDDHWYQEMRDTCPELAAMLRHVNMRRHIQGRATSESATATATEPQSRRRPRL